MNSMTTRKDRGRPVTQQSPRLERGLFRRGERRHDPLLVLSMSRFNFTDGWERTFSPIKAHEQRI